GTWDENLTTKPRVQAEYKNTLQLPNTPNVSTWSDADRKAYVQFYAYLQQVVDRDIMTLLDTVDSEGFTDNTLIFRMADHGEMALSHGLLEKTYNAYDETINVPLIISNPQLFPSPVVTRELAGHIDLLPTVASVAGVLDQYKHKFKGIDLSPLFTAPDQSLQEAIHFTFDDKGMEPLIKISSDTPRYIRALRTKDWLYGAYYGYTKGGPVFDYELYDLENDPDEKINLAHPVHRTPESKQKLRDMNTQLIKAMYTYGTTPRGFDWPKVPDVTPAEQARP
ncbi:MAG TPA: sulfatase-like hydrolase/transferase, partial [Myxococcaceae bacterium]|nr:sulfatase-like hydrolase/transferase [Myxococcaceae bacterium]